MSGPLYYVVFASTLPQGILGVKNMDQISIPHLSQKPVCARQEDGGVYSCIADNGVGSPAEALVNLQVLCKYSCPRENLSTSSSPKIKFTRK